MEWNVNNQNNFLVIKIKKTESLTKNNHTSNSNKIIRWTPEYSRGFSAFCLLQYNFYHSNIEKFQVENRKQYKQKDPFLNTRSQEWKKTSEEVDVLFA